MLVLHNGSGVITGLQTFPESTESPHIVVDDSLHDVLLPLIGADVSLVLDGGDYLLPENIHESLLAVAVNKLRADKFQEIERAQFIELQNGVPFVFGEVEDIVQTRSERDLINISGITTRGILLRSNAVTNPVIEFRAQSNTSYLITGEQAIALGETVAQHNEAIYQKAWALKDAITSATTLAELEAVQW